MSHKKGICNNMIEHDSFHRLSEMLNNINDKYFKLNHFKKNDKRKCARENLKLKILNKNEGHGINIKGGECQK